MKSNIKRLSFCLSALMLLILASPLTVLAAEEEVAASAKFYGTFWSLVPPLVAIALALITKEVYSSLFVGILVGALFYSNFNFEGTILHIFEGGMISVLTDSYNMGILIFLVILGTMVCLMNRAGGSAAFGRWASKRIKSRVGAELSTIILGVLIFIDDYFNCLTVGSVMRPVTDRYKVSRAKLAYIIDSTAAPVCIIAPISSWAAAVNSYVPEDAGISGFQLFMNTIPYNLYALLTLTMVIFITVTAFDFGLMKKHERNAAKGDLFTTGGEEFDQVAEDENKIWQELSEAVEEAAKKFVDSRVQEGEKLKTDLLGKLDYMGSLVAFIEERSPVILTEYRQKLEDKVKELLGSTPLDEGRIATEVTIYADKICVDEEMVRLHSHIDATRKELEAGGSVGRKLDFIAQEMNREANTTLSKSSDLEICDKAIALKTEIEKVREQIQNIE